MKLVIAGNYHQYTEFLRDTGIAPKDARFVWWAEDLYGFHDVEIVKVGQFWLNPLCDSDALRSVNPNG